LKPINESAVRNLAGKTDTGTDRMQSDTNIAFASRRARLRVPQAAQNGAVSVYCS